MIIVTGSLAFDHIMNFPGKFADHILPEKIHVLSLSFLVDKLKKEKGGTAGNIAYNLALLGEKPLLFGSVGEDFEEYRKHLEKVGVDTSGVKVIKDEFTSSAFIMTDQKDNQISGFYPGSMSKNAKLKIESGKWKVKDIEMVVISPNDPMAMGNFVNECIENKIPYMYDPGMQLPRISDKDLERGMKGAKILIGNDYEMASINNRIKNHESRIMENNGIIITTLGEKGCNIEWREENGDLRNIKVPPAKAKNVSDPTGAGDAFRAGFLAGYMRGLPIEVCGRMGNLAAVYTVEKYGTQTHYYTISQFCSRYYDNYKEKLKLL